MEETDNKPIRIISIVINANFHIILLDFRWENFIFTQCLFPQEHFKKYFLKFIFTEKGRNGERERNIDVQKKH